VGCIGRYSEAWQFCAFWCLGALLRRVDDSGGAGNLFLTDSQAHFIDSGIEANVGMVLYNLTQDVSGVVTNVEIHTLTAAGVTWDDGDEYRIVAINAREIAMTEEYLGIAASDIHAALAASGACDCSLASWAAGFLQKIEIIDAAAYYQCPCGRPKFSDEMRQAWLEWASGQLESIRVGKVEVCSGETGSEYPYCAGVELATTEFAQIEIILNDILRTRNIG
jgi:hypothetical protein